MHGPDGEDDSLRYLGRSSIGRAPAWKPKVVPEANIRKRMLSRYFSEIIQWATGNCVVLILGSDGDRERKGMMRFRKG
jgi:hypothetical protein